MPKLTPFLWFNDNAEEATSFYLSVFPNSKVVAVTRYGEGGPGPKGSVMTAAFQLDGQDFVALNGGPVFKFNEAVSLVVNCETQAEVDRYWDKLTAGGGQPGECGWLKDKFGFSWQVVPSLLTKLLADKDAAKTARVMGALMKMTKLDGDALQRAYDGA